MSRKTKGSGNSERTMEVAYSEQQKGREVREERLEPTGPMRRYSEDRRPSSGNPGSRRKRKKRRKAGRRGQKVMETEMFNFYYSLTQSCWDDVPTDP